MAMRVGVAKTAFLVCTALLALSAGCRGKSTGDPSAETSPVNLPPGVVQDSLGLYVRPIVAEGVAHYFHEQSSFTSECRVPKGTTGSASDIYCILDIAELDLDFNGVELNYNSPRDMCEYTVINAFSYFTHKWGSLNPSEEIFLALTDKDGNVSYAPQTSKFAGINALTGEVSCAWDYSKGRGPNCCDGSYWMKTQKQNADGTWGAPVSAGPFIAYGGKNANCLEGPAKEILTLDSNGYPMRLVRRTDASGVNDVMKITAPMKMLRSNLYAANYFDPAAFGNANSVFPPQESGKAQRILRQTPDQPTTSLAGPAYTFTQATSTYHYPVAFYFPYYEVACYDTAMDTIARIRVLIRAWDRVTDFTAKSNPYNPGSEPWYEDEFHDLGAWKDLDGKEIIPGYRSWYPSSW